MEFPQNPTPYDYSDKNYWMVLPKRPEQPKKKVDCIWFYPTSCMSKELIGPVDGVMKFMAKGNYKDNGFIFEKHCNMYAPYYHQLSSSRFNELTDEEIFESGAHGPTADCYAALDYYFEHYNNGRPFILAGHSQGANIIVYVLMEYMKQHPDYYSRMVAAYAVGYGMTAEQLAANPHIKPATGPNDTGVLISWNTEGPNNKGQHNFVVREGGNIINPINWKTDDTPANPTRRNKAMVDARIDLDRRVLVSEKADPKKYALQNDTAASFGPLGKLPAVRKKVEELIVPGFGTESFHNWDYRFFADSVSKNVKNRIDRFLK